MPKAVESIWTKAGKRVTAKSGEYKPGFVSVWEESELHDGLVNAETLGQIRDAHNKLSKFVTRVGSEFDGYIRELKKDAITKGEDPKSDEVQIGLSRFNVQPEHVHVDKVNETTQFSGLRTDSATIINTGRSFIKITLDLVFPSDDDVFSSSSSYHTLQKLLAQFRTIPFSTLTSEYIAMMVQEKLYSAPGEKEKEVDFGPAAAKIKNLCNDIVGALKWYAHVFGVDAATDAEFQSALSTMFVIDPTKDVFEQVSQHGYKDLIRAIRLATDIVKKKGYKYYDKKMGRDILVKLKNLMVELKYAYDSLQALMARSARAKTIPDDIVKPIIPIAYESVNFYSDPDSTQTVRAQLVLYHFYYSPYIDDYLWKDYLGRPTPYIEECTIYQKMVEAREKTFNVEPTEDSTRLLWKTAGDLGIGKEKDTFTITHYQPRMIKDTPLEDEEINKMPYSKRVKQFRPMLAETVTIKDGLLPNSFGISLSNRLALQPSTNAPYSTIQYMGAQLGRFHLRLVTTDDKMVKRIHAMDNDIKALAQYGMRDWRRTVIRIDNPYLALVGMEYFELESVTTEPVPGSTNATRMDLRFTQYGSFLNKTVQGATGYKKLMGKLYVKRAIEFLLKRFREYANSLYGIGYTDLDTTVWNETKKNFNKVVKALFGPFMLEHQTTWPTTEMILLESGPLDVDGWGVLGPYVLNNAAKMFGKKLRTDPKTKVERAHPVLGTIYEQELSYQSFLDYIRVIYDEYDRATKTAITAAKFKITDKPMDAYYGDLTVPVVSYDEIASYISELSNSILYPQAERKNDRILGKDPGMYAPAQRAMEILYSVVTEDQIKGIKDAVGYSDEPDAPVTDRALRDSVLYPDLPLPNYRIALQEMLYTITREVKPDGSFKEPVPIDDFNTLTQSQKMILSRFVPSFRDMGIIPDDGKFRKFVPTPDHKIPPSMPWHHVRLKDFLAPNVRNHPYMGSYNKKWIGEERDKTKLLDASLAEAERKRIATYGLEADKEAKDLLGINTDVLVTAEYKLNEPGDDTPWVPGTKDKIQDIANQAFENIPDNYRTMIRSFPAFKLFFIAENKKNWEIFDDVYAYNSVLHIAVTRHKYQTAIAELSITNLSGVFDLDSYDEGDAELYSKKRIFRKANKEDKRIQLTKFPLKEGTRIAIMFGYAEANEGLHTVFTGRIAQLKRGEVIDMVAQGYMAELTKPVGPRFSAKDRTHNVIQKAMEAAEPTNFGRWHPSAWKKLNEEELARSKKNKIWGDRWNKLLAQPWMRNVYTSRYKSWFSESVVDILLGESWDSGGGTKTAWDLIQETTLYSPGYVARVVPYDMEATLFWGRPDQLYYYTDGYREKEKVWRNNVSKSPRTLAVLNVVHQFTLSELYNKLRPEFKQSGGRGITVKKDYELSSIVKLAASYMEYRFLYIASKLGEWSAGTRRYQNFLTSDTDAQKFRAIKAALEQEFGDKTKALGNITKSISDRAFSGEVVAAFFDSMIYPSSAHSITHTQDTADTFGRIITPGVLGGALDQEPTALNALYPSSGGTTTQFDRAVSGSLTEQGIFPGTMLVNMPGWRSFVKTLAEELPKTMNLVTWVNDKMKSHLERAAGGYQRGEQAWLSAMQVDKKTSAMVKAIGRPEFSPQKALSQFAIAIGLALPMFHAFLEFFHRWLMNNPTDWVTDVAAYAVSSDELMVNPRMKPLRQYHMVTDTWDIISNDITCTREAMWNSVIISNGDSMPEEISVSDNLAGKDKIVRVFNEPNADIDVFNMMSETNSGPVNNRVLVGNSRVAQGIRKMYRGQLTIRGNARIKEGDIVYMYDLKNMMWGPIEVERVTHSFTPDGGFITMIKPECYVEINNYDGGFVSLVENSVFDAVGVGIPLLMGGATAAAGGFSPIGIGVGIGMWQAGKKISKQAVSYLKRTKAIPSVFGGPTWAKDHSPIRIYPLVRLGMPWVAALEGLVENKDFIARFGKDWEDVVSGAGYLWDMVSDLGDGFENPEGSSGLRGKDSGAD